MHYHHNRVYSTARRLEVYLLRQVGGIVQPPLYSHSLRVHAREGLAALVLRWRLGLAGTEERVEEAEHLLRLPLLLDRVGRIRVHWDLLVDLRATQWTCVVLMSALSWRAQQQWS